MTQRPRIEKIKAHQVKLWDGGGAGITEHQANGFRNIKAFNFYLSSLKETHTQTQKH